MHFCAAALAGKFAQIKKHLLLGKYAKFKFLFKPKRRTKFRQT